MGLPLSRFDASMTKCHEHDPCTDSLTGKSCFEDGLIENQCIMHTVILKCRKPDKMTGSELVNRHYGSLIGDQRVMKVFGKNPQKKSLTKEKVYDTVLATKAS